MRQPLLSARSSGAARTTDEVRCDARSRSALARPTRSGVARHRVATCSQCSRGARDQGPSGRASTLNIERQKRRIQSGAGPMKNSNRSLSAKRRYWRERLAVAKRSVNIDGFRFPTGSVLPHRKLSQRALDALIDWRGAAWQTRTGRTYPKATKLPEPEKPLPQIK